MKRFQSNTIVCSAKKEIIYQIIKDSNQWPVLFEPCLSVKHLKKDADAEHIQITALVNDIEMTWESYRLFLDDICGINSTILAPMKLVSSMQTYWRVLRLDAKQCMIVLEHHYEISDNVEGQVEGVTTHDEAVDFIKNAINKNSYTELLNIKHISESLSRHPQFKTVQSTSHVIECCAPAAEVYEAIKNVNNWPNIIDACIATSVVEKSEHTEVIKIDALIDGNVKSWKTYRDYFPEIMRIDFYLPVFLPLVKAMSGCWRVIAIDEYKCLIAVERNFEIADNISDHVQGIETPDQAVSFMHAFINENTEKELHAIKSFVEKHNENIISCTESYFLPRSPLTVFETLANIKQWPHFLPHCESVKVIYDDNTNQEFLMNIKTAYGNEQIRSIRQCNAKTLAIQYFQPEPPETLRTHSGSWTIKESNGGAKIVVSHQMTIDPIVCKNKFQDADIKNIKKRIKELVLTNSKSTIAACDAWLGNENEVAR